MAALGGGFDPGAWLGIQEFLGDRQVARAFQLAKVDGQVPSGKTEGLLDEGIGKTVRGGLGDEHCHDAESGGLVDGLVEEDLLFDHEALLFRSHKAPNTQTVKVAAPWKARAVSPAKWPGR